MIMIVIVIIITTTLCIFSFSIFRSYNYNIWKIAMIIAMIEFKQFLFLKFYTHICNGTHIGSSFCFLLPTLVHVSYYNTTNNQITPYFIGYNWKQIQETSHKYHSNHRWQIYQKLMPVHWKEWHRTLNDSLIFPITPQQYC